MKSEIRFYFFLFLFLGACDVLGTDDDDSLPGAPDVIEYDQVAYFSLGANVNVPFDDGTDATYSAHLWVYWRDG